MLTILWCRMTWVLVCPALLRHDQDCGLCAITVVLWCCSEVLQMLIHINGNT